MKFIFIFIVCAIGIIIWLVHKIKIANENRLSDVKKQKESLAVKERQGLRAEERIVEQREARKDRAEAEVTERKAKVERDIREVELRRKIKDRKALEVEEEKRKTEEHKESE